jgi:hypothetical protein
MNLATSAQIATPYLLERHRFKTLLWAAWLKLVQHDAESHGSVGKRYICPVAPFSMLQFLRLFTLLEDQVGGAQSIVNLPTHPIHSFAHRIE